MGRGQLDNLAVREYRCTLVLNIYRISHLQPQVAKMAFRDWLPEKFHKKPDQSDWLIEDDGNEEANRLAARLAIETLKPTVTIALENVGSVSRWLLASLLTVNSAALVALITNADKIENGFFYGSLVCFLLGVIAAFSIGLQSIASSNGSFALVGQLLGYWSVVEADGERCQDTELELFKKRERNNRVLRKLTDIGKFGLAIFLIGTLLAAVGARQAVAYVTTSTDGVSSSGLK